MIDYIIVYICKSVAYVFTVEIIAFQLSVFRGARCV